MLAKSDKYLQDAVDSVYVLTQDEKIRQQCEAREDYRRRTAGRERMLKEALEEKEKLAAEKQQLTSEKQQLSEENQRLVQLLLENGIKTN